MPLEFKSKEDLFDHIKNLTETVTTISTELEGMKTKNTENNEREGEGNQEGNQEDKEGTVETVDEIAEWLDI